MSNHSTPALSVAVLSMAALSWLAVALDDGDGVVEITPTIGDEPFSIDVDLGSVAGGLDADALEDAFEFVEGLADAGNGLGDLWDTLQSVGEVVFTVAGLLLELLSAV
ncbi:hypothetical protein O1611_g9294 [Lasiodiplodia mahajangana]|uniref:Uncharacterized protein n=1 Tax=Lasiodiplodia mahajangana TaxID=1108764 RepID=A0ACC2JAA9_9PEZI|nr:hypothetical protein O1611_g9294 [Lasiodiplodia mahajangana]